MRRGASEETPEELSSFHLPLLLVLLLLSSQSLLKVLVEEHGGNLNGRSLGIEESMRARNCHETSPVGVVHAQCYNLLLSTFVPLVCVYVWLSSAHTCARTAAPVFHPSSHLPLDVGHDPVTQWNRSCGSYTHGSRSCGSFCSSTRGRVNPKRRLPYARSTELVRN